MNTQDNPTSESNSCGSCEHGHDDTKLPRNAPVNITEGPRQVDALQWWRLSGAVNGAGVDGAVVRNLVGDKSEVVTGGKGPGKAEITMYYEPFKLTVANDPSGAVTSQVSTPMGLIFPHLPAIVGKLGDVNYEYGACPTIDIKCAWPLSAIHFSYEITFQRVK